MTILFILEYYHPHTGGVETFFKNLVQSLSAAGYNAIIITNRYNSDLPAREIDQGVEIRRYRFYNRYLFTFGAWLVALRLAGKVDLIHTTSYNAAVPSWVVAKMRRKKSIITFHEVWANLWDELPWMSGLSKQLHRSFESLILRLGFDRFVAVSDYTKTELLKSGIHPDRVCRIYNGIEYNQEAVYQGGRQSSTFEFLFFGRVSYSKGVDLLLEASLILKAEGITFRIRMILPSEATPLLAKAKATIALYGLGDRVTMEHDLDVRSLQHRISQADAVVIPSYSEGFCFAAVETMAIGTPIVSSGRGALKEVISGKYVEMASFDPQALAMAMKDAMSGNWHEKPPHQFPLQDTINSYIALYNDLLGSSMARDD